MNLVKEILLGFSSYIDAHQFIRKHKLWFYVFFPGIINMLLFAVVTYFAWITADDFTTWLFSKLRFTGDKGEGFIAVLKNVMDFIIVFSFRFLIILLYLAVYQYLVLILMSPVMAYLSEKTEKIVRMQSYPFNLKKFLKDVLRGIFLALKNTFIELLLMVLIFFIGTIPVVTVIVPVLLLMIRSYYYGFSMIDYSNERKGLSIKDSSTYVFKHKGLAVGIGCTFYGLLIVPVIGLLVAPSYGVIAATLAVNKIDDQTVQLPSNS